MSCGDTHTCVLTDEGEVFTFGRNQNGQLGLGTDSDCLSPTRVGALQVLLPTSHCVADAAASGSLGHSLWATRGWESVSSCIRCKAQLHVSGSLVRRSQQLADCLQGRKADPELCCGGSIILILLLWLGFCTIAVPCLQHRGAWPCIHTIGQQCP